MKLLLLLLLLPLSAFAGNSGNPFTYRLNASVSNLTATFPVAPQLSGPMMRFASVDVFNTSAGEIEVNCSSSTQPTSTPGSINSNSFSVPGNYIYFSPVDGLVPNPFGAACWIRSVSGTISSGIIEIVGWGY